MPTITYNLCETEDNSNHFYQELHVYTEILEQRFQNDALIKQFISFNKSKRSPAEHGIELISLGLFWKRYLGGSQNSLRAMQLISRIAYKLRTVHPLVKHLADSVRGFVNGAFLIPSISSPVKNESFCEENFKRLLFWLRATGEFEDEVKRLQLWFEYFHAGDSTAFISGIQRAEELYLQFKQETFYRFHDYTSQVQSFLLHTYPSYRFREDEIFCGKDEEEYHLNMLASSLMNRSLQDEFSKIQKRVVLVPACMSRNADFCKATHSGLDISCNSCDANCNVNKAKYLVEREGATLFIVPHSSSFTKWLDRWSETSNTSVVAVACLLNIAVGGYQMRERDIPSQCVLLDYCGCQKHWSKFGVPTDLNHDRLKEILRFHK